MLLNGYYQFMQLVSLFCFPTWDWKKIATQQLLLVMGKDCNDELCREWIIVKTPHHGGDWTNPPALGQIANKKNDRGR